MTQLIKQNMRQEILIDRKAKKEIQDFPQLVRAKIYAAVEILSEYGKLDPSNGKKLSKELFEIRVRSNNCYRCIYAYCHQNKILILSGFVKKQQKTPLSEIKKANNRLKRYK